MENSSLDKLAHVANLSHELQQLRPKPEDDDTASPSNDDTRFRPRRLACTWCRQQKSRCDAQERLPQPCTRCLKKGLSCQLKPEFKRTEKRARLALIEKEFAELKRTFRPGNASVLLLPLRQSESVPPLPLSPGLHDYDYAPGIAGIATSMPIAAALATPSAAGAATAAQLPSMAAGAVPAVPAISDDALVCEEKLLGDVCLAPHTIRLLYLAYVDHYHPLVPVVDVTKGPERIYRLCPALFWVLMFVALRRLDNDKATLLQLSPLIKDILAEITISPITRYNPTEQDEPIMNACSVFSVQAFILYSLWPPLTSSLSADSSWNTIGVALFQAIRIGLHLALLVLEKDHDALSASYAMAQEQMKTWIVCNVVLQSIAAAFGFPAFVQFDFLLSQYCQLPLSTRHLMEIAHFEDQVVKTLGLHQTSLTLASERLALMKVLLQQLDELEIKLYAESPDDGFRKLHLIVARIHLLTHFFLDAGKMPPFELSKGLVRLHNVAASLVAHVEMCEAKHKGFVQYLPVVSVLSIWQALCIIVKLANSPLKSVIDVAAAKTTYVAAIRLVAKASVLKHDIAYRASGIMRNMWQLFRTLDASNMTGLSLTIRSRMAALVFFDCLSVMRDQVGMAKLNIRLENPGDHDDGGLYEENESGEEAVVSSDEQPVEESQKTTPGSSTSSGKKKRRALSGLQDAEYKARKIIRTIPLDPQPISASKRSSIFKVVNTSNDTSPSLSVKADDSQVWATPGSTPQQARVDAPPSNGSLVKGREEMFIPQPHQLELGLYDMNNDLLWKDVDSLMNDFGFHA